MNYIDRKKICCLAGALFYAYYVIKNYIPFSYRNVFAGVDYNGRVLFYAAAMYLFGIVILYSFGNTENYIKGYGILELTRSTKRRRTIRKIIISQIKNMLQIVVSVMAIFILFAFLIGKKETQLNVVEFIFEIGMFYIVSLSLTLWQSIFEIIFDSRIAILVVMSIIGIHIYAGDFIALHNGSKYLNLVFYCNLALAIRTESLGISKILMMAVMVIICIIQTILLNLVFMRKDIFSVK